MAYYAALVSVVQLLKEINHHEYPYSKSLFSEHQDHAFLYEKLSHLQELLKDYSPKDINREKADFLERRIRDIAYQTEDILESQISNQIPRRNRNRRVKRLHQQLQKVKFEVDSIVKELMRIKVESLTTNEDNSANSSEALAQAPSDETTMVEMESALEVISISESSGGASKVQAPSNRNIMVGFDEHVTTIKVQLCGQSSNREVISIVGTGGIGKTTLARNILYDKLIDYHFDCRVWVTVSQDYHVGNILLAIVDSLNINKDELHRDGEEVSKEKIYKHLKGRRYLIIMDDVWDTKIWDDVKRIFPDDSNGSRVILTTRLLDVAVYVGKSSFTIHLEFLNEDQSWNLFSRKVFCPVELEDIGRLIARNFRGLPLAIVVVAGLLSKVEKTRHHWEDIATSVSSAVIDNDDHFSKIFSLSYNHLPHHLKPCFLYLGGFPEDDEIYVFRIILLWVAEGFIRPIESKSLEEVAEEYLEDLVNRNLVLITEKKSDGKFKRCIIHDLLRDLCSRRAHYENFLLLQKTEDLVEVIRNVRNVRRLSIHHGVHLRDFEDKHVPNLSPICHVRSVLVFREFWYNIQSYMSQVKLLKVLDALKMELDFFPVEIVDMLHLKYLALQCSISHIPPSIFKFQNLLMLINNGETSLPSEIWKMSQLRHVIFRKMTLPPIPYGERNIDGVPLLGMLQTLYMVKDFTFTRDTVEMIPSLKKLKARFEDFKLYENAWEKFGLNNLVHLRQLETLEIIFDISFEKICDLISLPESIAFPLNLRKLTLKGCQLPWKDMTVVGSLPNLRVLKLKHKSFEGEEWEPIEGEFLKLKFLQMERLSYLKYWRAENTHFPCLEQLKIKSCFQLEIPSGIGDIPTLELINVSYSEPAAHSALKVQEEQRDLGNDVLQVRLRPRQ